jgi:hypothetical protein
MVRARPRTPLDCGTGTPFSSSDPGAGMSAGTFLASIMARSSSSSGRCNSMNSPVGQLQRYPGIAAHLHACGPCGEDFDELLAAVCGEAD